jgi:hypothetical protein
MTTRRQVVLIDVAADTAEGEAARWLDPLWVLARQWQMGELQAEDNGSPVQAQLDVEASMLSVWQPGPPGLAMQPRAWNPLERPIESLVEGECWHQNDSPHWRLAAETGTALLRLLMASGLTSAASLLKSRAALTAPPPAGPSDPASQRFRRMVSGRALDGLLLRRSWLPLKAATPSRLGEVLNGVLAGCTDDHAAVLATLDAWLESWSAWLPDQVDAGATPPASPAWQSERQEYAFSVGARLEAGDLVLSAREHLGGSADWHDLVIDPSRSLGGSPSQRKSFSFLPTPVQFKGMPMPRFWELEDGRVNLPRLAASERRQDPASQLFLEFALRYSNDWFMLPLPLPVGSVSRLHGLTVHNTFGEAFLVGPDRATDGASGGLFRLSVAPSDPATWGQADVLHRFNDVFLLPVTADHARQGQAVESVRLVRDELANLAWAIELIVEGAAGQRIDRVSEAARQRPPQPAPAANVLARYRLGTEVPPHWLPLVPEPGHRLRRAALPRFTDTGIVTLEPLGRLMEPGHRLVLLEQEVPREGARVERRYRLARSANGASTLWLGRVKGPGQGEMSSGLRFDAVEPLT